MLIAASAKPSLDSFKELMCKTDIFLNDSVKDNYQYYKKRSATQLEDDIKDALDECAKGTPFQGTVEKISGMKFPDIIIGDPKIFGVEVKSTKKDHWVTTGSSILESTRVNTVERIYLTFCKMGGNIQFISRPYEECLYSIGVTHMPRYKIDMRLEKGNSIFDKMRIPYDTLRKMDNPVPLVANFLRSQLKKGERLWWADDDTMEEEVSYKIRTWDNLTNEEQVECVIYSIVNFPEIFNSDFENCSLWLASQGIVNSHLRDSFSSGGQIDLNVNGFNLKLPGIYRRLRDHKDKIINLLIQKHTGIDSNFKDKFVVMERPGFENYLSEWCQQVSTFASQNKYYRKTGFSYDHSMIFFKKIYL